MTAALAVAVDKDGYACGVNKKGSGGVELGTIRAMHSLSRTTAAALHASLDAHIEALLLARDEGSDDDDDENDDDDDDGDDSEHEGNMR